jgi:integrase/recombinase XerD
MKSNQNQWIHPYTVYLKLEKSLSPHTVNAYLSDVQKWMDFLGDGTSILHVKPDDFTSFLPC